MKYYSMYMNELGIQSYIDLTAVDLDADLETDVETEKQRKIDKNELRLRQELLDTQAKFNALTHSLQSRPVLDSRMPEFKSTPLPEFNPIQMKTPDLPSKTYEKYQDVKSREIDALRKMEESNNMTAKAETRYEVDRLIEKYQLQRQERVKKMSRDYSEAQSVRSLRK